jgi:formamidopyrimidine-DNA glycosylase
MPELPDVEVYRRRLNAHGLRKKIGKVAVTDARILDHVSAAALARKLEGRQFTTARRRGKHLLAKLDKGGWLTVHFGMTGDLLFYEDPDRAPPYTCVRLDFPRGAHLSYVNRRKLGRLGLADDIEEFIAREQLGPDALDRSFDVAALKKALGGTTRGIKAALMDQSVLAGIGNIFSDEILFQARIDPRTPVPKLDAARLKRLHGAMRRVLQEAIRRGAGSETFLDRLPSSWLLPQRRNGGACPRGHGPLKTFKLGGRTGYYCPRCQR